MVNSHSPHTPWVRVVFSFLAALCLSSVSLSALAQVLSDFNGDKRADILWRNSSTGDVSLWQMDGFNLAVGSLVYSGLSHQWQTAGIGDFDGDKKSDILWRNVGTGDVSLWQMNGANIVNASVVYHGVSLDWQVVGLGDFNGDGKSDILWRNNSTGDIAVWLMNGTSLLNSSIIYQGLPLNWQVAGIGDVDGDGKADVLWRNSSTGDVAVWLINGFTIASGTVVYLNVPFEWQIVGIGDFNGDGKSDVLWRNTNTGDVSVWLMNGIIIGAAQVVYTAVPLQWQIVRVGDYDGDGKADVLWYNTITGDVYLWEMNGTSISNSGYVFFAVPLQWQIVHPQRKVFGLNFSPYVVSGQDPNYGTQISSAQITTLLSQIAPYSNWVRTFGSTNGLENVGGIAHSLGLKTAIGAFINQDTTNSNSQLAGLIRQANAGNVDLAIVGNENLLRGDLSESQVLAYLNQARQQLPAGVKLTYVDTWDQIVAHPNVIAAVDIVAVNIYPFYENASIDTAFSKLQSDYQNTVNAAGGKPVWIMETGWPSGGNPVSFSPLAIPSPENAAAYFRQAEQWARSAGVNLFYFESYDEPWKANYSDYSSWGIWNGSGNLKAGMNVPFQ